MQKGWENIFMEKVVYKLENGKTLTFKKPDKSLKIEKYLTSNENTNKISTKEKIL